MDDKQQFVEEIAKKIPIEKAYDDLAHPALSAAGQGLGDLVELTFGPIRLMKQSYERVKDYLDFRLKEYFEQKKIDNAKLRAPAPEVAIPAIEALRYTDKSVLKDMYVRLLGASMNVDTADFVHPSFVDIIGQLTPDEAKILKQLPRKGLYEPLVDIMVEKQGAEGSFLVHSKCGVLGFEAQCEFPEKISLYMDNLVRLSLVHIPEQSGLADSWRYDKITSTVYFQKLVEDAKTAGTALWVKRMAGLTDFGADFRDACLL